MNSTSVLPKISVPVSASTIDTLVIVAGGRGLRLTSLAGDLPKALVPIGSKPLMQHQIELAQRSGVKAVTILAGYLSEKLIEFVGEGSRFGVSAQILVEQQPMGNAGAMLQSLDSFPEHFFLLYGDLMLSVDLERLAKWHLEHNADVTALVHPNDHPHDSDLLEDDGNHRVIAIHSCPHREDAVLQNLVNSGLYCIRREALRQWAGNAEEKHFTRDVMQHLIAAGGKVLAYSSTEYIKDIGTPARLEAVEGDWRAGRTACDKSSRPAIFLDRDGTLSVEKGHLRDSKDLQLFPGVGSALKSLREAGFRLVVLTNQPVIARGEATENEVAAVHRRLEWELGKQGAYLDRIYVCPHHPDRGFAGERAELKVECECRKPGTALFERACRDLRIDVKNSWLVGDQTRDVETARRAGIRSILVQTGFAGHDHQFRAVPDYIAADLPAAANIILTDMGSRAR